MATGSAMQGTSDMSRVPRRVSGVRRVAEGLVRRLNTPRTTCPSDRNYGICIADSIQDTMTDADVATLRASIKAECEKDADVETAIVSLTWTESTKTLRIRVQCFGPQISFVFTADATADAGVTLLEAA